ncbi:putative Protein YgiW [uncultured delta proteobacterium]|uniref:Uncharacterized protein n=1 Tax=uncultured delta proteobacterium TaxID=34034 RepID=A0A212KAY5_9DELT|nr:putative Protein YgiW [uncultured delta proteobacterium]
MRFKLFFGAFFFILATAAPPATALAAFVGGASPLPFHMWPKGSVESGVYQVSVQEARQTGCEMPVVVRGNITQYAGSDQYVFEDATSSILVSIPPDRWHDQDVTPEDLVELHGRLLRSSAGVRIAVAKIIKLQ